MKQALTASGTDDAIQAGLSVKIAATVFDRSWQGCAPRFCLLHGRKGEYRRRLHNMVEFVENDKRLV